MLVEDQPQRLGGVALPPRERRPPRRQRPGLGGTLLARGVADLLGVVVPLRRLEEQRRERVGAPRVREAVADGGDGRRGRERRAAVDGRGGGLLEDGPRFCLGQRGAVFADEEGSGEGDGARLSGAEVADLGREMMTVIFFFFFF